MIKRYLRYSLIAITLVLISSLIATQIPALGSSDPTIAVASSGFITAADTVGSDGTINPNGTITNPLKNWYGVDFYRLVPDPSSDGGPSDQSPLFYYNLLPFLSNLSGVNCIRIHIGAHTSYPPNTSSDYGYFSTTYTNTKKWCQEACSTAKADGIKVLLSCFQDSPMTSETDGAAQAQIILNTSGWGTNWINDYAQILKDCQPDGVEIMNEPDASVTFAQYRAFVVECCTAFRKADPNVTLFVMGNPYWDMGGWASNPLTEFSNVFYSNHLDYDTVTLGNSQWAKDYNAGNLATAKTELYSSILSYLQPFITAGLPVCWTEDGVEVGAGIAHWDAYLKDLYAFVKQYDEGFIQFALAPYQPEPYGILTSNWTQLNDVGLCWKDNFLS
jgi:hypothetical protein